MRRRNDRSAPGDDLPPDGQVDIRIMGSLADVERVMATLDAAGIHLDGARRFGLRGRSDGLRIYATLRT